MLGFGAIAFATPWVLAALAVLPVLWWLLRVTPPAPRVVRFPAIRLLRDLVAREETPARTPWWLLLLRLAIAALVILALAGPLLNPRAAMPGGGPVVLVVDNGWAAGRDWPARRQAMEDTVAQAGREGRPVIVITTAHPPGGERIAATAALPAPEAQRIVQALTPLPWPTDRAAALEAVRGLPREGSTHAVWISDGIGDRTARDLALALQRLGSAEVLDDLAARPAHLLLPPASEGTAFVARVVRADAARPEPVTVRLTAGDGRLLTRQTIAFDAGQKAREVRLEVPAELRNEAAALRVENDTTAGATVLLDERWRRRPVGLVSGRPEGENQPLLSDLHYLNRALEPYNEVRQGVISDLLKRDLAVLILSDVGSLTGEEASAVETWVRRGGVLLRFAGPRLAQNADTLVPVRLRIGDRALGGALSWSEPARLQPFDAKSPFAGLRIPPDVTVQRQVLAEPSLDLADRTWARLADGTPLVTAEARGDGHIVMVHTTASPDWSNLPLSGLFVDMLRRMVALSEGVAGPGQAVSLEPLEVLDGFGRLIPAPPTAFPIGGDAFRGETIGPRHPPGFYGTDEARRALNLTSALTSIDPLGALPPGVARSVYGQRGEVPLKPHLLGTAMALAIIDLLIALALRGLLGRWARPRRAVAAGLLLVAASGLSGVPSPVRADDGFGLKATAETYLAFVRTGDSTLDNTVKSGLDSLVEVLNRRTAVEAAGSMGVDVERDELAFFPLLYWAVSPSHPPLTDRARTRLNDYMRHGGVILFDTRDQGSGYGGGGMALRQLTEGLDVPALGRVNPEHVLTKSFYLLQDFPGRYAGSELWVEAREGRLNDGVSSVIIGGNDWASAWASDRNGQPLYAVVPGGERQREMAFRFGVNVVMYALTGNYKADQVHVPAILERLGQ